MRHRKDRAKSGVEGTGWGLGETNTKTDKKTDTKTDTDKKTGIERCKYKVVRRQQRSIISNRCCHDAVMLDQMFDYLSKYFDKSVLVRWPDLKKLSPPLFGINQEKSLTL